MILRQNNFLIIREGLGGLCEIARKLSIISVAGVENNPAERLDRAILSSEAEPLKTFLSFMFLPKYPAVGCCGEWGRKMYGRKIGTDGDWGKMILFSSGNGFVLFSVTGG